MNNRTLLQSAEAKAEAFFLCPRKEVTKCREVYDNRHVSTAIGEV